MDVIITAGGVTDPENPLYPLIQGKLKCLLEIGGKPLIQWVLDAVSQSTVVEQVVLVGLESSDGLESRVPLTVVADQGSLIENILAGAAKMREVKPGTKHILMMTADIPAITGEMIDWVVSQVDPAAGDLFYFVVEQDLMEATFPGCNRSFISFKDVSVCGADLNVGNLEILDKHADLLRSLTDRRKNAFAQARVIGFDVLYHLARKTKTLEELAAMILKRFGMHGVVVRSQFAEIAMDVDKPHQYEILRDYLTKA